MPISHGLNVLSLNQFSKWRSPNQDDNSASNLNKMFKTLEIWESHYNSLLLSLPTPTPTPSAPLKREKGDLR